MFLNLLIRLFYLLTCKRIPNILSLQNLKYNEALPDALFPIKDQHAFPTSAFHYGKTTVSACGCAAVALFNALYYHGLFVSLPVLIRQLECSGALSLGGLLGTAPWRLLGLLKTYPLTVVSYSRLSKLESALSAGECAILAIQNHRFFLQKGAHYFMVYKTKTGFTVLNRLAASEAGDTLSSIIGKGRLIMGYRIAKQSTSSIYAGDRS